MTSRTPTFKRVVLAGILCASAGLGLAQTAPAAGPATPGPRAEAMGRHDPARMQARMDQRLAVVYAPGTAARTAMVLVAGTLAWAVFAFWLHGLLIGIRPIG